MVANIQVLRCVAAMTVFFHHLQWDLSDYMGTHFFGFAGRAGVDIFFVISGFIMFHTTRNGDRALPDFWSDRLIRIVPVYWLMTVLLIVLVVLGFNPSGAEQIGMRDVVASFAFFPVVSATGDTFPIVDPGWTLIYEMYFYFLFGLTFFLKSQVKALCALVAFFAATFALSRLGPPLPHALNYVFEPITFEFAAGGLLALLYRYPLPVSARRGKIIGYAMSVVGFATIFTTAFLFGPILNMSLGLRTVMVGGPAVVIVAGALILEKSGAISKNPTLMLLGAASYAIYLSHEQVIIYTIRVFNKLGAPHTLPFQLTAAVVAGVLALSAGLALYMFFEKPFTAWLKSRLRRSVRRRPVHAE